MGHKFNGTDIRTPTSFTWDMEDDEAGGEKTADGKEHSTIVASKVALSYQWSDPSVEETATIFQLVAASRYVSITYPDPTTGGFTTGTFKPTKKGVPFRELRVGERLYQTLSLDFKEQ